MDRLHNPMPLLTIGSSSGPMSKKTVDFISIQRMLSSGPSEFRASGSSSCLIVGGNWDNGDKAGLSCANVNNDLSNSNDNIGARLAYPSSVQEINVTLGKDHASRQKNTKNITHSIGRRACGYGRPKTGFEVDRTESGVCL